MFGRQDVYMDAVMEQIDTGMPKETIVVGDGDIEFMYRSRLKSRNFSQNEEYSVDAVALTFTRKGKARGVEEIQIHAVLSSGVSAIDPDHIYQVVSAREMQKTTMILASQGGHEELDWDESLRPINDYVARNHIRLEDLFIEVQKHRKCFKDPDYEVLDLETEGLWVSDTGIKEADRFRFFCQDPTVGLSLCNMSMQLKTLKQRCCDEHRECIGALIFSCCTRIKETNGHPNAEGSPFLMHFPGSPLAGMFCSSVFLRGPTVFREGMVPNCFHRRYSTVYLVFTAAGGH